MTRYCLALIAVLATTDARVSAIELIENGSFEADGPGQFVTSTAWDDGPGIGNDIGFAVDLYPFDEFTGEPLIGPSRPLGAGDVMGRSWGAANGDGHRGSATQFVDVSRAKGRPFKFTAWLAGSPRSGDNDYAVVTIEFFAGESAAGESLASLLFDGNDQASPFIVGSANEDGLPDPLIPATEDNWTLYRANGVVPVDSLSAAVVIRGAVPDGDIGFGNDALVDLVSLQVVPEPSGLVSVAILLSLVACWAVRQRVPPLTPITGTRSR